MAASGGLRRKLRIAFPDHCALWLYGDCDNPFSGNTSALRRHAMRLMLQYNRDLKPWSLPEKIARVAGTFAWPLNALLRCAFLTFAIRKNLPKPARDRPLQVFLHCWYCAMRYNITPSAYYKFRLFLDPNCARIRFYLQDHEMAYLVRLTWESLNLQLSHTLNDKLEFYKFCQKYDLSTAPVLAHCSDSNTVVMLAPTAELKRDLMLKFTNSAASEGVELIAWDGTTNEWRHQNASITESQLMDLLRTKSLGRSAILQPSSLSDLADNCLLNLSSKPESKRCLIGA